MKAAVVFLALLFLMACAKNKETAAVDSYVTIDWNSPIENDTISGNTSFHIDGFLSSNVFINGYQLHVKSLKTDSLFFEQLHTLKASYFMLHEHLNITVADSTRIVIEVQTTDEHGKSYIFKRYLNLVP